MPIFRSGLKSPIRDIVAQIIYPGVIKLIYPGVDYYIDTFWIKRISLSKSRRRFVCRRRQWNVQDRGEYAPLQ